MHSWERLRTRPGIHAAAGGALDPTEPISAEFEDDDLAAQLDYGYC